MVLFETLLIFVFCFRVFFFFLKKIAGFGYGKALTATAATQKAVVDAEKGDKNLFVFLEIMFE